MVRLSGFAAIMGLVGATALLAPMGAPSAAAATGSPGYWLLGGDGGVFAFGSSEYFGSSASSATDCPANPPARSMPNGSCWSMAAPPDNQGYWIVNAYSGKIFPFGDAVSYGQPADSNAYAGGADMWPNAIGIVSTPDSKGYWVLLEGLSGLGSVQAFGDATFYGDEISSSHDSGHVGYPVAMAAMAATPDGKGYWIVDSDGGVFAFGDAAFQGSKGSQPLNAPVVGVASTAAGKGYWLAASGWGGLRLRRRGVRRVDGCGEAQRSRGWHRPESKWVRLLAGCIRRGRVRPRRCAIPGFDGRVSPEPTGIQRGQCDAIRLN